MSNSSDQPIKKVCGYVRVSTEVQATDGESLDTQKKQIVDYCESKRWNLIGIYEDAGISGSKADHRPAFMKMMNMAKAKQFDIIVFTKLSRFARNARDFQNFQHELEKNGVSLASIKESIDPTSYNGKLMAGIFALLAEWEREMIREQMAENKMSKWRSLRLFNGLAPFGYSWDKKQCLFVVNPEEASLLERIVKMYVNLGVGMKDIAIQLNDEGLRSRRSKWSTGTLSGILKNNCYSTAELVTNTRVYNDGKRTEVLKPESEWIVYSLPRIISKELWSKVEKKREFNKVKQKRTTWQQEFWLRDLLKCGLCGSKISAARGNSRVDGSFPRYYACCLGNLSPKELKLDERPKCKSTHIHANELEAYVWDYITFSLTGGVLDSEKETENIAAAVKRFEQFSGGNIVERVKSLEDILKRHSDELSRKERAINRLFELLENEDISVDNIRKRIKANEQEICLIEEQIKQTKSDLFDLKEIEKNVSFITNNQDLLFAIWNDLQEFGPEDRKILAESLVRQSIKVVPENKFLGPTTVEINLKWNDEIFQYFASNNKMSSFVTNGSHYSATDDRGGDS